MITALDKNKQVVAALADTKTDGHTCRVCGNPVVACGYSGGFVAPYFRHKASECTDTWAKDKEVNGMSDWHRNWQERFKLECREVTMRKDKVLHRSDIYTGNTVIEFQHSYLTGNKIKEREDFYDSMVWVIDWEHGAFSTLTIKMFSKHVFLDVDGQLEYVWVSKGSVFGFKIEYCVFVDIANNGSLLHYIEHQRLEIESDYYKKQEENRKRRLEEEKEERERQANEREQNRIDVELRERKDYPNFTYTNNPKNIKIAKCLLQHNLALFIGSSITVETDCGSFVVDVKEYENNGYFAVEEFSNLKHLRLGWFDRSKADALACICPNEGELVLLRFDAGFKEWYIRSKDRYPMEFTLVSGIDSKKRQVAQRIIPLRHILNWVSFHRFAVNSAPKSKPLVLFNAY